MKPFLLAALLLVSAAVAAEPLPLLVAHAHNDYMHARPLFDALERGFCGVEADIWLVAGGLLVAHDLKDVKPDRTLAALYLDPLLARVRQNRGHVYPDGAPIRLLVDVKSEAGPTYAALHTLLARYAEMLTAFPSEGRQAGPVTVVVSGNRDEAAMRAQTIRYAALDGRKAQLDSAAPADLFPLISDNWRQLSTWDWRGPMPDAVRASLGDWVARAHAHGRKLRFWNVPDRPDVWQALLDAGVDVIGADDLAALQTFLLTRSPIPRPVAPQKNKL